MTRMHHVLFLVLLAGGAAACGPSTSADATKDGKGGVLDVFQPAPAKVTIPSGTRLRVALIDGVSTTKSSPGDEFMASLAEPVTIEGKTVLEKGLKVRGRVTDVQESGRVKGRASLKLVLTEIVRNNQTIEIRTNPFTAVAESTKKRDAAIIGGGAGVGAAIGGITGGGKGAAVGALIGGGAGTGTVLATKGKELHYPPETRLNFTLSSDVEI